MHLTPHEWIAVGVVLLAVLLHGHRRYRRRRRSSLTLTDCVRLPFGLSLRIRKRF